MYWVGALFIGNAVYICMCSCIEQIYGTIISLFSSLSSLSLSTAQTNTFKSFDLPWLKHNFFHLLFFLFCLLSYVILYISKRFKWFSFYRLWIYFLLHSSGFFVFLTFLCCFYWFVVDCLFMVCFDLLIAMRALRLKRMIRAKSELNFHWVLNVLLNRYWANLSDIISGIFNIKSFHCYLIIFLKWSANVALSSSKILMFFLSMLLQFLKQYSMNTIRLEFKTNRISFCSLNFDYISICCNISIELSLICCRLFEILCFFVSLFFDGMFF